MSYVMFPYERVRQGSRIIVYGMGWLGKMFVEQIEQNHYCEVVFAVDRDYQSKKSNFVAVKSPTSIQGAEYDYIVIAMLSISVAEAIKEDLIKWGVPVEKCVYKYALLESDREQILQKINGMNHFLCDRVGKILYGLESYAENELWRSTCPDWRDSWLYKKFQSLRTALTVYKIDEPHRFVRIGQNGDGGYLIVDNYPLRQNGILYAFGVGGDVSFEYEMAEQGWQIYMYDHTVSKLPQKHPAFHYQKRGLIGRKDEQRPELSTLPEFLCENGHMQEQDMLLKMDIEGYEIDVFCNLPEDVQVQFSQIVLELHGLDNISNWDALLKALTKISRTHRLVHLHANNWGPISFFGDGMLTEAVELTFVRTADWHFSPRKGLLLRSLDVRCDGLRPERLAWQ
ncbi:FkbM family methyltransferase [Selenomonas ruminantium]|uniref:Methyltransferase domain-containing protein n=1 Tax=Selenomonas ruminantium TaxID=971 RepID=A0A1K1N9H7_SELRU|nr:FkbM family methyltransferase [Selenomonas ruminantium]SFW32082.1 Methyltransferase domain-containing protein [Selenomonas ruminantium]